ncbi:MAG: 3-oxoacyl-[acyl-carrier-protein] synthase III C-terminal domain-containing protein [bacterium]|nr:3-oxoacyl-[acyl-carrier-protein] synthase III C-terminal domain-containing protein [bacterium]
MNASIIGSGTAVPEHAVEQEKVRDVVEALFGKDVPNLDRLLGVFDHGHIRKRHFMKPTEWYSVERGFEEANAAYVEAALKLSIDAVQHALDDSGMNASDVDTVVLASTTGIATPSIDALLMLAMNIGTHAVRVPMFGLGCAAGVAGLARAAELCVARKSLCTLFVAVEICSATFQRRDISKSNLVGTSLFADGAGAIVLSSDSSLSISNHVAVVSGFSTLFPNTEDIMGWDVTDTGLAVRFSRDIPGFVEEHMGRVLDEACEYWGITRDDIGDYVTHPGGAKVMAAYAKALDVPLDTFAYSVDVLRDYGNMSSATVLFVLDRMLKDPAFTFSSRYAMMSSLGPGFSAEKLLLRVA